MSSNEGVDERRREQDELRKQMFQRHTRLTRVASTACLYMTLALLPLGGLSVFLWKTQAPYFIMVGLFFLTVTFGFWKYDSQVTHCYARCPSLVGFTRCVSKIKIVPGQEFLPAVIDSVSLTKKTNDE